MDCCGKIRKSKFCPECGKPLAAAHPLAGLIAQCRQNAKQIKTRENETQKIIDEHEREGLESRFNKETVKRLQKSELKWTTWADELEKLIDLQKNSNGGKEEGGL